MHLHQIYNQYFVICDDWLLFTHYRQYLFLMSRHLPSRRCPPPELYKSELILVAMSYKAPLHDFSEKPRNNTHQYLQSSLARAGYYCLFLKLKCHVEWQNWRNFVTCAPFGAAKSGTLTQFSRNPRCIMRIPSKIFRFCVFLFVLFNSTKSAPSHTQE